MKTYEESERTGHSDTEITLGTRSILGIFFALALICGIFFGFGYSLGRGSAAKASQAAQTATQPPAQLAAVNPANAAPPIKTIVEPSAAADGPEAKPQAGAPVATPADTAAPTTLAGAVPAATPASIPQVTKTAYTATAPQSAVPVSYPVAPPQAVPAQAIMVQIAAVSSRNDADALVTALQKLGYRVSVRSEPGDQLLHIQVGPFATRDAAKAMRARLLNDGYNAILK